MPDLLPSRVAIQSFFLPPEAPRKPRIRHAEGIWFEDTDGNRLIDASSGPVASNLGHGNPRVLDAMMRQARRAAFAYPLQFESEANVAIAERLAPFTYRLPPNHTAESHARAGAA